MDSAGGVVAGKGEFLPFDSATTKDVVIVQDFEIGQVEVMNVFQVLRSTILSE